MLSQRHDLNRFPRNGVEIRLSRKLTEDIFEAGLPRHRPQPFDAIVSNDTALVEDNDIGAELFDNLKHMSGKEDHLALVGEGLHEAAKEEGRVYVEAREGFIEDEEVGVVQHGGQNENALTHALGIGRQIAVASLPHLEQAQELSGLFGKQFFFDSSQAPAKIEIFFAGEMRV